MSVTITLDELLASRDRRHAMQQRLLAMYPGLTPVVLTVVMPGSVKQTRSAAIVAQAGLEALQAAFGPVRVIRDLRTGYEAYWLTDLGAEEAKRRCVAIEEQHPLGRLMDIDVITADCVPFSRVDLQSPPRRCLICGRPARECMRSAAHPLQQLLQRIDSICNEHIPKSDSAGHLPLHSGQTDGVDQIPAIVRS